MPTHGGIEWTYVGPLTERWEAGAQQITFGAKVAWDSRRAWRSAMLGYATHTEPNLLLARQLPYLYPEDPGLVCTQVDSADHRGIAVDVADAIEHSYRAADGTPTREGDAFYRVTCQSVLYRVRADVEVTSEMQRFVTQRERASAEAQRVPRGMWRWTGTTKKIMEESAIPVMLRQFTWTFLGLPKLPPALTAAVNCVNSANFTGPDGVTYGAETLLMEPPAHEPRTAANLQPSYELSIVVNLRGSSWNKFFAIKNPVTGAAGAGYYDVEAADGSGRKPYQPYNFATLFTDWRTP